MGLINNEFDGVFANVISDGSIRVKVDEGTPGAVRRDYELADGTKGTKFELKYSEIVGKIVNVEFYEGDYGKNIITTIDDGKDKIALSLSTAGNFGEDFMKKLPNIDFGKEVRIVPYSFTDDKKKIRKGITVYQEGNKITSFFSGKDNEPLHDFPQPEKTEGMDSDDWKIYFMQARKFLIKYLEENIIPDFVAVRQLADEMGGEVVVEE